jgi:hypothetical protein
MRFLWHIRRELWWWVVIPMYWDQSILDYREHVWLDKDGQWKHIAIQATSLGSAHRFIPRGSFMKKYEIAAEAVVGVCGVGDVVEEWWESRASAAGAKPRAEMRSMPVRPLEVGIDG